MNVLSVDGGGIRGLIPALVLADLEERTGKRTCDLFDLIAGTSTGGIIALALTVPGESGRPRWTANDLVGFYLTEGPRIFHHSIGKMLESGLGLLDEKFDAKPLEKALATYMGETMISEALTDVLVPSYDLENRKPFFFKTDRAKQKPEHDWAMHEAARATTAAPTYFEPEKLTADGSTFALCDGGVFAANPAMCAYAEARRRHPRAEIRLVSLGTGQLTRPLHYDRVKNWGLIRWARPLVDVVFDGVSDATDYELTQLLPAADYTRFQIELKGASDSMDNAHEANLEGLQMLARKLIADRSADLDRLASELTSQEA
jgi:patatin-like phospholipase/acyl hydrolase